MPLTPTFTHDELVESAVDFYRRQGWSAVQRFTGSTSKFVESLSLRPSFLVKRDGMEYLCFPHGKISQATFKLMLQVVHEIDSSGDSFHVVVIAQAPISKLGEKALARLGVGILELRVDDQPRTIVEPSLRSFVPPRSYDLVPSRYRTKTRTAIEKVVRGDVCIGVMDLCQVVEEQCQTVCDRNDKPLGWMITELIRTGNLSTHTGNVARRMNKHRIKRAHPARHTLRRKVVNEAQNIVDCCLALLFHLS